MLLTFSLMPTKNRELSYLKSIVTFLLSNDRALQHLLGCNCFMQDSEYTTTFVLTGMLVDIFMHQDFDLKSLPNAKYKICSIPLKAILCPKCVHEEVIRFKLLPKTYKVIKLVALKYFVNHFKFVRC